MRAGAVLAVLMLPLASAGCVGALRELASLELPPDDMSWLSPCAPEGRVRTGNAPEVPALRGTPVEVARDVAAAFNDKVVAREDDEAFRTRHGRVWVFAYLGAEYEADDAGRLDRPRAGLALDRLVDDRSVRWDGTAFVQEYQGHAIDGAGATFDPGEEDQFGPAQPSVYISSLHALPDPSGGALMPTGEARAIALGIARCELAGVAPGAALNLTGPGLDVAWDSLAWSFAVRVAPPLALPCREEPVAELQVIVDAVTGAYLRVDGLPDCAPAGAA